MKKKFILGISILFICLMATGCKQDDMEDIDIAVTNYPNEYIVNKLYGNHSTINRVYPDDVSIKEYKVTNKQKETFSKMGLFVYTGLVDEERKLAVNLLDKNRNLKIIDTSYVLETDYENEELWLNPSSLLMMAQNVRLGLKEYVTSNYLSKEIDKNYNKLKIELSELDAEYRVAADSTDNKTIIVANSALKYLEKFGLNVICLDSDASQKTISDAEELLENKNNTYIIMFKGQELNENVNNLLEKYPDVSKLELHRLDNISDTERSNKENYVTIMRDNLELIKKELYQ